MKDITNLCGNKQKEKGQERRFLFFEMFFQQAQLCWNKLRNDKFYFHFFHYLSAYLPICISLSKSVQSPGLNVSTYVVPYHCFAEHYTNGSCSTSQFQMYNRTLVFHMLVSYILFLGGTYKRNQFSKKIVLSEVLFLTKSFLLF